ncbi:MAG: succinate dehydrogenase cytochrome b subunit [Desulfobacterales bacterium]
MVWIVSTLWTPIGKKLLMAVSGVCFCMFLTVHLAGNLTLYSGSNLFVAYAQRLHQLGILIIVSEWGLMVLAMIHVSTGSILFYENRRARPVSYKVNRRAGGRTLASATMPYTGFAVFAFVIYHLLNFHFADRTNQTIYQIVADTFSHPGRVFVYALAMAVAALHVRHGFWSLFQTLGADHPKYMPMVKGMSILFSLIIGFGFGVIPIYMLFAG